MKNRIIFITAVYPPQQSAGASICKKTVESLEKIVSDVTVVTVNREDKYKAKIEKNICYLPMNGNPRVEGLKTRLGIKQDYLDRWTKYAMNWVDTHLNISKDDVIFVATVGEVGTLCLGDYLKTKYQCKLIINFHDPIKHATMNDLMYDTKFHVKRDKWEKNIFNMLI